MAPRDTAKFKPTEGTFQIIT